MMIIKSRSIIIKDNIHSIEIIDCYPDRHMIRVYRSVYDNNIEGFFKWHWCKDPESIYKAMLYGSIEEYAIEEFNKLKEE